MTLPSDAVDPRVYDAQPIDDERLSRWRAWAYRGAIIDVNATDIRCLIARLDAAELELERWQIDRSYLEPYIYGSD